MDVDFSYLEDLLDSAIAAARADRGAVQILVEPQHKFFLAAQTGFSPDFLATFPPTDPTDESTTIGRAASKRQPVLIEDVERDDGYGHRNDARRAGFRSVNAMPLISSKGNVLGVLLLLFKEPHQASTSTLRALDTYGHMAGTFIEAGRLKGAVTRADPDSARRISDVELKAAIRRLRTHPYNSALVQQIYALGDQYVNQMRAEFKRIEGHPARQ